MLKLYKFESIYKTPKKIQFSNLEYFNE